MSSKKYYKCIENYNKNIIKYNKSLTIFNTSIVTIALQIYNTLSSKSISKKLIKFTKLSLLFSAPKIPKLIKIMIYKKYKFPMLPSLLLILLSQIIHKSSTCSFTNPSNHTENNACIKVISIFATVSK